MSRCASSRPAACGSSPAVLLVRGAGRHLGAQPQGSPTPNPVPTSATPPPTKEGNR